MDVTQMLTPAMLRDLWGVSKETQLLNQCWTLGNLQRVMKPDKYLPIAKTAFHGRGILPDIKQGNDPIALLKPELEVETIPMARAWITSGFNEYDMTEAERTLALLQGQQAGNEKRAEEFVIKMFDSEYQAIWKKYLDTLTFMFNQMLTNPEGATLPTIGGATFHYKLNSVAATVGKLSEFKLNPEQYLFDNVIQPMYSSTGNTPAYILIGSEVAREFLTSDFIKETRRLLQSSGFNYKPVNVQEEVSAKGAYEITEYAGTKIIQIVNKVWSAESDGMVDSFDPRAVVGISNFNDLAEVNWTPTKRNENGWITDASEVSYYEYKGGANSDKQVTYRSEGYYITAIKDAKCMFRLDINFAE